MGDANTFAERLRMLRSKKKASQEAVAAFVGCSQNAIGTWERGESAPQVRELVKLCEFYDVAADFLVGRSDYPSGLAPDSWIIDVDAYEAATPGSHWAAKVPRRVRIVDFNELLRLEADMKSKSRKGKGKGAGDGTP